MDIFLKQFQGVNWEQIIFTSTRILLVLLLAWLGMVILRKILSQLEQRLLKQSKITGEPPSESEKRVETLIRLIRQAALIVLWVTTILILLKEIGIDVGPILASAGIVGLAVGFGAQNLVRDFISGFFFILENQVRVGDVAIV